MNIIEIILQPFYGQVHLSGSAGPYHCCVWVGRVLLLATDK